MMSQDVWQEFQETLVAYTELRARFDQVANQARYTRSAKIHRALYEVSSKLREYDGLLLQLCQSMGSQLKGEIAELSDLRNKLITEE